MFAEPSASPQRSDKRRVRDWIGWDVRNWSRALDFWRRHSTHDFSRCQALELGAGRGGLSLWLAEQGATVECSDVAGPAERAVRSHREHGVAGRITYTAIDATAIPYADRFDIVLFKSVLGLVGLHGGKSAQAKMLAEVRKALRPGGELFFAENLVGSPLHMLLRRRQRRWGSRWRYVSLAELHEMLAGYSFVRIQAAGVTGALGSTAAAQDLLGTLDERALELIVPDDWKYIAFGVARK